MYTLTKNKLREYAQTLPAGTARSQCYNIANIILGERTLAQALEDDHNSADGAKRAAQLMVNAGCAIHKQTIRQLNNGLYGTFIFEDDSEL